MVQIYLIAGALVTLGVLWFWIVRPIAVAGYAAYAEWRESSAPPSRSRRRRTTRRTRPALPVHVMLRSSAPSPHIRTIATEQRSYAAERSKEHLGTQVGNTVPALAEHLGTLADDQLLRELALVVNEDGAFKYAESRIAKFIGGRVEDRIAQVRAVRKMPTPPKNVATKNYPNRTEAQALLRQQLRIGK